MYGTAETGRQIHTGTTGKCLPKGINLYAETVAQERASHFGFGAR